MTDGTIMLDRPQGPAGEPEGAQALAGEPEGTRRAPPSRTSRYFALTNSAG